MAKPLSRPNEVGRVIGYKVDIELLREKLKQAPVDQWQELKQDRTFIEQVQQAAKLSEPSAKQEIVKHLWVVLKIEHGVPVMIDAYRDKRSAVRREQFLRQHMRPDIDQVGLFQVKL